MQMDKYSAFSKIYINLVQEEIWTKYSVLVNKVYNANRPDGYVTYS